MVIRDTCAVPEVIEKLQSLIDEQQIRIQEASEEASTFLNQIKTLRTQVFSLKNSVYNAQQGLKDIVAQRNAMCDFHYSKTGRQKVVKQAYRTFSRNDNYDDENFETQTAKDDKDDRAFECQEPGCTKGYPSKKSLKRHVQEKHGNWEDDPRSYNENVKAETRLTIDDNENWTGHPDTEFNYENGYSRKNSLTKKTEYPCDECSYIGAGDKLKRHKDTVHSDMRPFICDFCEYSSKRKDKLKEHIKKKH